MDVADVNLADVAVGDIFPYALAHSTRRAVGEREAEHVVVSHTKTAGMAHALHEDVGLAASRRGEYEVLTLLQEDNPLLTEVWTEIAQGRKRVFGSHCL